MSFSQQAVQACHACIEVARSHLTPDDEHPHLVLCGVASRVELIQVLSRFRAIEIACRPFYEPDIGGQLTAVATEPVRGEQRRYFRKYRCLRAKEGAV